MDRSQLRKIGIWLISLCLSISPFWSVSAITESNDSLETAFDGLDESVQSELVFKRLMIEAIDTSLEINSALGFDSSSTFQRAAVVVPAYALIRGTYFAQRGLFSDIRHITPEKRKSSKTTAKQTFALYKRLIEKEQALKVAEDRLLEMKVQASGEILSKPTRKQTDVASRGKTPAQPSPTPAAAPLDQGKNLGTSYEIPSSSKNATKVVSKEVLDKPVSITSSKISTAQVAKIRNILNANGIVNFRALSLESQSSLSKLGLDQKDIGAISDELDKNGLTLKGDADKTATAQADEGKVSTDPDKTATAQTDEGKTPADADKPATAQADEGKASTRKNPTFAQRMRAVKASFEQPFRKQQPSTQTNANAATSNPAPAAAQTATKQPTTPVVSTQTSARHTPASSNQAAKPTATNISDADLKAQEFINKQQDTVEKLKAEIKTIKADLKTRMGLKFRNIFYRGGRLIRNLGFLAVGLAGIPVYIATAGEMAIVVFDLPEDMEALKQQYIQDIEEVILASS